jgi:hypothetical protein
MKVKTNQGGYMRQVIVKLETKILNKETNRFELLSADVKDFHTIVGAEQWLTKQGFHFDAYNKSAHDRYAKRQIEGSQEFLTHAELVR